jgi:glycopeptide antibiotics resistance protein
MNTSLFRNPYIIRSIPWIIGIWTIIILYLTVTPSDSLGDYKLFEYDKLGHAVIFGGWTFLLGMTQLVYRKKTEALMWPIALTGILFGATIELMQYILPFNRNASWEDIIANIVGCVLALVLLLYIKRNIRSNEV